MQKKRTFLEFFAGGGMARLGLGENWRCLLANDFDPAKCTAYRMNFGGGDLIEGDIAAIGAADVPGAAADLAWASFPCQDLSLAGARAGLSGARSGAFFAFARLMDALAGENRAPRVIAIENVTGLLTSNDGADFAAIVEWLAKSGYAPSALVLDARHFTPQSRPRLFIFGFLDAPDRAGAPQAGDPCAPPALLAAVSRLTPDAAGAWRWLSARPATTRNASLADIVDLSGADWSREGGARALAQMAPRQREAVEQRRRAGGLHLAAAYRRVRIENGARVQRVEARFDGLAGCLRTPAGGSSRQLLIRIEEGRVAARLLRPREAARLMGLPEDYALPEGATAALKLAGDGVCVRVVEWVAANIVEPALARPARAA